MSDMIIENHPWEPFIPEGAKVLILGTFPPKSHRWSMDFYYPNRINDFWRVMGLVFHGQKDYFVDSATSLFNLPLIKEEMSLRGIALHDTGAQVRRLKDNASDKFLEIVKPVNLSKLLGEMPSCRAVVTTGEKAATIVADLTGTTLPKMGESVVCCYPAQRELTLFRMPSTSRAYPMSIEKKAEYYGEMFRCVGIL